MTEQNAPNCNNICNMKNKNFHASSKLCKYPPKSVKLCSKRVNLQKFLNYSDQLNSPITESNAQRDVEAKSTFTRSVLKQILTYLCSKSHKSMVNNAIRAMKLFTQMKIISQTSQKTIQLTPVKYS